MVGLARMIVSRLGLSDTTTYVRTDFAFFMTPISRILLLSVRCSFLHGSRRPYLNFYFEAGLTSLGIYIKSWIIYPGILRRKWKYIYS